MGPKARIRHLKKRFKEKLSIRRSIAERNQTGQEDNQPAHNQQRISQDNTLTSIVTNSHSRESQPALPASTSAPSGSQSGPSCLRSGPITQPQSGLRDSDTPISELWNLAYENLRKIDADLIAGYEARLRTNFIVGLGSSISPMLGSRADRRDQMNTILQRKMYEINRDIWKLKLGASEIQVKDLVQPVLGVVKWANEYITGAVNGNHAASIAWGGISLLLPVCIIVFIVEISV